MNSLIISYICIFFRWLSGKFTASRIWSIIQNINSACSKSWQNSKIMSFCKKEGNGFENSLFAKIIFLPFTVLELLRDKIGEGLNTKIKSSIICEVGRCYVHSFMALNTRFWGILFLSASVIFNVLRFTGGNGINKYVLAVSVFGGVMCIFNYNVTGFLSTSWVAKFFKACSGFNNLKFDFYDETKLKGRLHIVSALIIGGLTGLVMSVMPLYGILVPFAAFGMLLVLQYPITGVYAAVFIAPLIPFSSMPLAGICIWTIISLALKSVIDKNFKWKRDGVGAALLLFLAVLFISCVFSFAMVKSLVVWAMYFVFVSFYFAVINTINTRTQLFSLLRLFVISGALVALYGVMQYVFGWTTTNAWIDEAMFEEETMRVFSTLANPNVLGEYILLVLPVSAAFFLKDKVKTFSKWVYLIVTGILFLCLILTQSRGCWLGFMVSVAIFVTFYEGRLWAVIPFIICLLPFVLPQTIIDRLMSVGDMGDSSTSYRVFIWMGTMGMLRHYLVGGIGMGEAAFNQVYPFFSYNAIIAPHSHNTFLQLLVEGGIPALTVFLAVIVAYLRNAHKCYSYRNKKSRNSAMILALSCGVCGFLFQSLFDYTFYNYRVMAVFFMVLAMTVCFGYVTGRKN